MSIAVYLSIRSDSRRPEAITSYLGMEPTLIRTKGDVNRPGQTPFTQNVWAIRSRSNDADNMEASVADLIAMIKPLQDRLCMLRSDCKIELDCHIMAAEGASPIIGIDRDSVRFLADIGASIGIDYVRI